MIFYKSRSHRLSGVTSTKVYNYLIWLELQSDRKGILLKSQTVCPFSTVFCLPSNVGYINIRYRSTHLVLAENNTPLISIGFVCTIAIRHCHLLTWLLSHTMGLPVLDLSRVKFSNLALSDRTSGLASDSTQTKLLCLTPNYFNDCYYTKYMPKHNIGLFQFFFFYSLVTRHLPLHKILFVKNAKPK